MGINFILIQNGGMRHADRKSGVEDGSGIFG
jgi:hypothetical protein